MVRNINLNISRNAFEAKINDNDSIFSFNFNNIDQIIINEKKYKNYFSNGDNRVYQVIYNDKNFSLLKGFSVKLVTSSGNPMVNRSNDKYVKKREYFFRNVNDNLIESFRLNKRSLNKVIQNSPKGSATVLAYIELNDLSYKNELDVVQILTFAFGN